MGDWVLLVEGRFGLSIYEKEKEREKKKARKEKEMKC